MKKLKAWRLAQDKPLTLDEAGALVGVTKATWQRWEVGTRKVSVGLLAVVVKCTDIPRHELRPDIFGDKP